MQAMKNLRYHARRAAYALPFINKLIPTQVSTAAYWDNALPNRLAPYMGGTVSIAIRDAIMTTLIGSFAKPMPRVLDVGCASGTLARKLPAFSHYVGTDISNYAIKQATAKYEAEVASRLMEFIAADFTRLDLKPDSFDVIAFSELLYLVDIHEAAFQVERYAAALSDGGLIIISMKDDGKSQAIYKSLQGRFAWQNGILFQEKIDGPDYRIRINQERPGYLIGMFKVREIPRKSPSE